MILTNDIHKGVVLKLDGQLFLVTEFQHVNPGKGGAFVRTKLKNLTTNLVLEKTFRSSEKFEDVQIERRKVQFLYDADGFFTFMDNETYEQYSLPEEEIGNAKDYLQENMTAELEIYDEKPINLNMPNFVEMEIVHTEPGLKGDSVSNTMKPAEIETGATVMVPLFVNIGDKIKIDTRNNSYVERVK